MTTRETVASALFDFLGFLTTRETVLRLGASELTPPAIDALKEWAALRGLYLSGDGADPQRWEATP